MKRLALIAAHQITVFTQLEKTVSKPFNPLLGETYELKTEEFDFIAEQVSHHPPITAVHCQGKNYKYYTNNKANTSFSGRTLQIKQQFKTFIELDKFDEKYELESPVFSVHNLIIGQIYVDVGETMTVTNLKNPELQCKVKFTRRSWFSKESFKFEGEVFKQLGKTKEISYTLEGNWNDQITLVNF